jgi:hypothetical protein
MFAHAPCWRESSLIRRGRNMEMIMSKPPKEFINPKTLIAPAVAVYSHVAKVNRGRQAATFEGELSDVTRSTAERVWSGTFGDVAEQIHIAQHESGNGT